MNQRFLLSCKHKHYNVFIKYYKLFFRSKFCILSKVKSEQLKSKTYTHTHTEKKENISKSKVDKNNSQRIFPEKSHLNRAQYRSQNFSPKMYF